MADEPQPKPEPGTAERQIAVLGGAAAVVGAVTQAATAASRWTAQQVITVFAVISVVVTNSVLVWLLFETKNDRRDERRDAAERSSSMLRSVEDARERDRQFQSLQREADRGSDASQVKMILEHCAAEARKQRDSDEMLQREMAKTLQSLSAEIKAFGKKNELDESSTIAPLPKAKVIVP